MNTLCEKVKNWNEILCENVVNKHMKIMKLNIDKELLDDVRLFFFCIFAVTEVLCIPKFKILNQDISRRKVLKRVF